MSVLCPHLRAVASQDIAAGNRWRDGERAVHMGEMATFWLSGHRFPAPSVGPPVQYVYDPDADNGWMDYYVCRAHRQTLFRGLLDLATGRPAFGAEGP